MKKLVLLLCFLGVFSLSAVTFDQGIRRVHVSSASDVHPRLCLVVPDRTPLLDFAAKEFQMLLEQSVGSSVPIVRSPSSGCLSLILGDCSLSRAAGLSVSEVSPQGYWIRRMGDRVYLLGKDSRTNTPLRNSWAQCYEHGTLSAVYDFMERFADARFFFPGKLGTIIPQRGALRLPVAIDIRERPDCVDRRVLHYDGTWYEEPSRYSGGVTGINMNVLRLRLSEIHIPFGHGLAHLQYMKRFKDHPEYFAMMPDGSRYNRPELQHTGHLCFNSGIREEIYQDVKAYFTGKPATTRGMRYWNFNSAQPGYFSLMTQDWLYWCGCEKCRKIAPAGRTKAYTPEYTQAISDFMWQFTADIANRLTREGIPGIVTQMAYTPYSQVPACDIPQNVAVQVAVTGPGKKDQRDNDATIRGWVKKTGGKITLWTYPGKYGAKAMPGIPAMMHNHMGRYFQERKDYLFGAFIESETDFYIFNYLNYYVFAKTLWNMDTDIEALLQDHFKVMFGNGAEPMRKFYDTVEAQWLRIVGHTVDTALGPVAKLPTELELWTTIYSGERMAELEGYFQQAESVTANQPEALARVRYMRAKLLRPIQHSRKLFESTQSARSSWQFVVPGQVHLRPLSGDVAEVLTVVRVTRESEGLVIDFQCEEPRMQDAKMRCTERDDASTFEDSCVEIFLNPSGDLKHYLHLIVNARGTLTDYKNVVNEPSNRSWNSKAVVRACERKSDGWSVQVLVPWSDLGACKPEGFPVNFARHRALRGKAPKDIYYQWNLAKGSSFHDLHQYGKMLFKAVDDGNIIRDGEFLVTKTSPYRAGIWRLWESKGATAGQAIELDERIFISGGKSLHLKNGKGTRINAVQYLEGLKPNTTYELSYFVRTKNIAEGTRGAGAYLSLGGTHNGAYPYTALTGTNPWHCLSFRFTTPATLPEKPSLGLWIWEAEGEAWFDHVRIVPVQSEP